MPFRFNGALVAIFAAAALAGCASRGENSAPVGASIADSASAGAPVALAPQRGAGQSVAMPVDQDALAKAVERLRITKKKQSGSPYQQAGADLNSDGRAKAIVLFTGQDWCSPQGCTLAIFEPGDVGYRPVSLTTGVKAPVAVGPGSNAGWRDLIVKTGANKVARLQFSGGGYPAIAVAQGSASADVEQSELMIQPEGASQTAASMPAANGGQTP